MAMTNSESMYQNLMTKNTFLDLPCTVGFNEQVFGSSTRRSSSSPPALDRDSLWRMKEEDLLSPFHLVCEAASTTDDGSEHSISDDRSSLCSELQDVAEVVQAVPARPWAKDEQKAVIANAAVEQVAGPETAETVTPQKQPIFSHHVAQQNEVQDIPAVPVPERPWARRRQVANETKPAKQDLAETDLSLKTTAHQQKLTPQQTTGIQQEADLLICYFQNRHLNNPQTYSPCGKGDSCRFCHEMHPAIKRRNCKVTAFCRCGLI